MTSAMRELLPSLPPELRNEVYNYLSTPDTTAPHTTFALPLKLKTFECKHTKVQICPVHYGSTGLLSLHAYRFQDASEYKSWLLNNGIELKIGVAFHGRVNNFVQLDWDKKMETHLRKLAKHHPWLMKVARYDVQILWNPSDGLLRSRRNKRTAGQIVRDITTTLTSLAARDGKGKKRELNMKLFLHQSIARWAMVSGAAFGFTDVLTPSAIDSEKIQKQTREVWVETPKPVKSKPLSGFIPVHHPKLESENVLESRQDTTEWTVGTHGHLVLRKHVIDGKVMRIDTGFEEEKANHGESIGYGALNLLRDC